MMPLLMKLIQFRQKFGLPINFRPVWPEKKLVDLQMSLIEEEYLELLEGVRERDMVKTADAIADLNYVLNQLPLLLGIDIEGVMCEVHKTNMLKEGGAVREDGKILKPPAWEPPNVEGKMSSRLFDYLINTVMKEN